MINVLRRLAYIVLMPLFGIAWAFGVLVLGTLSLVASIILWVFIGGDVSRRVDSIMDPTMGGLERGYRRIKP